MGHCLQAIIGKTNDIEKIRSNWIKAEAKPLTQDFALIRINAELIDDLDELTGNKNAYPYEQFDYLSAAVLELLKFSSHGTKLAYIETNYFGGIGTQAAVVIENGAVILAPPVTKDDWDDVNGSYYQTPPGDRAINLALRKLGIECVEGCDEFDSIRLGWER